MIDVLTYLLRDRLKYQILIKLKLFKMTIFIVKLLLILKYKKLKIVNLYLNKHYH